MSHSQFHCTGRAYLDMHGLIFETSICYWQDQPGRRRWDSGPGGPQRKACVLAGRLTAGWGRRRTPGTQRPTTPAARTDDGPPDNSTEGTSGAGPHRGVAEGRGGKPQAPPPPPHPRHGPPPRRPGAPSSHVGTGRHARALARADRRGVATRAKAQGHSPPPTQERHGYDGRPAAASRVPTRAQVSSAEPGGRGTRQGVGGGRRPPLDHTQRHRRTGGGKEAAAGTERGRSGPRKARRTRTPVRGSADGDQTDGRSDRRAGARRANVGAAGIERDATKGRWRRGRPQASKAGGGGPRGPSPKTRCESAARARHGVSPPEASSTTAVPPQHPGRRLASPSTPGGPPSRGPHERHRRHRRATAGPVETSLPRHLPTTTPHTPHAPAVPNPLPPPPRAQGDTREAHHPGTPARPRRPGGDTHTR